MTLPPHQLTGFGVHRKILLVEDEEAVKDLLSSYLKKEAFEVTTASDVTSAIEHLGTEFDVVVTDLNLPGRWGAELVAAVKARWPGTQVLVISGILDENLKEETIRAGADAFVQKPFGMADLRAALQEQLARRKRVLSQAKEGVVDSAEARVRSDAARKHAMEGIRSLVAAVEIRDPCTRGHHHRVTLFAQAILRAMDPEIPTPSPLSLAMGTENMDIGMIGVPDHILLKLGSLNAEETEVLKEHPEIGRRILQPIIKDEVALEVVNWHHERWDGGGYPNGLSGSSIPVSARIAAVADTLDALTSCRAHRRALEWDEAVERILEGSGRQFDPSVIAAFQSAIQPLREIWEGLATRSSIGSGSPTD